MELKLSGGGFDIGGQNGFNRTFMELKRGNNNMTITNARTF